MRDNQLVRIVGIVAATAAYVARLAFVGNGTVGVFGYEMVPLSIIAIWVVVLALPETLDQLPFGPNRTK